MISRTTIVFARPFDLPGFDETLSAGYYDCEAELSALPDHRDPEQWRASVMVRLHSWTAHPGQSRNLTVSLAALDGARACEKLTGKDLATFLLDALLDDMTARLVTEADRANAARIRHLYTSAGYDAPQAVPPFAPGDGDAPPAGAEGDDSKEGHAPIDLDMHRSAGNLVAANIRRLSLRDFEADRRDLRKRQQELESRLLAEPARTWPEAAARAQYLIRCYAETAEAQDASTQNLVERALVDLARLMETGT